MTRARLVSYFLLPALLIFSACALAASSKGTKISPTGDLVTTIVAGTLTAYPTPLLPTVPVPAITPQDFISCYFDRINAREYTLTWSFLSDRFKGSLAATSLDGYQVYVDFWETVNLVTVLETSLDCQGEVCTVDVILQLDYASGQSETSIHPYTLSWDRVRGTWLFDLLPMPTITPSGVITATAPPVLERPEYKPGDLAEYSARSGDSLPALAAHFDTTVDAILAANPQFPAYATTLQPGIEMKIPITPSPLWGTALQIMPDSLFVNGPSADGFNTWAFIASQPGWLKDYREEIGGTSRSAAELINIVAANFSLSPRTLLVLLEYQSAALSNPAIPPEDPSGQEEVSKGLYRQLVYDGNILNAGYYGWRTGSLTRLVFPDYTLEHPDPWQNAATVAFQYYYSITSRSSYDRATGPDGLKRVVFQLFGDPWAAALDKPHLPASLQQPALSLPFAPGYAWAFTGGPHNAWGEPALRPWAAVDFAPQVRDCDASDVPATAMADGVVARSEAGVVVLDLDEDGNERTGWNILYLHIAGQGEAQLGQRLKQGDMVGFPSCEGGASTGTHVHIARKYNGEWMPLDGVIPLNMEGWTVQAGSAYYKGTLTRGGDSVTASFTATQSRLIRAGQ